MQELVCGEIAVIANANPEWSPVLGKAAAVITETGGVLSNFATLARKAKIPAVVSATGALALIQGGEVVTVNGKTGQVFLHR